MQIGVDSFGAVISDQATGLTVSALQRMDSLLDDFITQVAKALTSRSIRSVAMADGSLASHVTGMIESARRSLTVARRRRISAD
jgi:hypothetical protein